MANSLNQYSPLQSALALLQPTVSIAQKRQDADRNLMLQSAMTQQSQQQVEMAKQQALLQQQAQAQLASVPFLPKDQERWQLELDGLKKKIRNRVENDFGGDHEAYAKTMLDQDIQNLALDAQRSPLYANGLQRRSNYVQAQKDAEQGKIFRSVQYKLTNGQTKVAPWEQAYLDFSNGDTEELPYQGAFKVDGKWRKHFDEVYSPRVGQLGKFRPDQATPQEIAAALTATEGLTAQDAQEYLRRTGPMLAPVYYKYDAVDPYRLEELRQGRERNSIANKRNQIAADKNKVLKGALGGDEGAFKATFNNPDNIITRNPDGSPGAVNVTLFSDDMKQTGGGKLQGFDGALMGDAFTQATGAKYDKKTDTYMGGGGKAYVAIQNQAGGMDLRATDLSGLRYQTKPGNIYWYGIPDEQRSEYDKTTGSKGHRYMQEQIITITSNEARKSSAGKLFSGVFGLGNDYSSGYSAFGNTDTATGKGAYSTVKLPNGETAYQFKILQPVRPTALTRMKPTLDQNLMTKSNQAAIVDAYDDEYY